MYAGSHMGNREGGHRGYHMGSHGITWDYIHGLVKSGETS